MNSAFLNLVRGNRLSSYMGLRMAEGHVYKFAKNYLYVEIPILSVEGSETGLEVKRNQHVFIRAACSVEVRGDSLIDIEPNSELAEYGQVQGLYRVQAGSGQRQIGFWFTARKDTDLSTFDWAVRIYMPS